jgi:hypothetical protein
MKVLLLFLLHKTCAAVNKENRSGEGGQGNVACSVRQNKDGVPAPAGCAQASNKRTFLSAAGDVFQKGPVRQQIRHKILVVHPA